MINGTLLLQMVHFAIGYGILRYILLEPALQIIDQQQMLEQEVNRDIVDTKNKVAASEVARKNVWRESVQKLLAEKPSFKNVDMHVELHVPVIQSPSITTEEKAELVNAVAERCVEHIIHEKQT